MRKSGEAYRELGMMGETPRRWRREDGRREEEEVEEISSHGWSEQTSLRGSIPASPPQAEAGLAPAGRASGTLDATSETAEANGVEAGPVVIQTQRQMRPRMRLHPIASRWLQESSEPMRSNRTAAEQPRFTSQSEERPVP
ncbi:hypothetical protein D4764_13G0005740 [Takifugu flavidus]|uniref:Uncharacterized protein n=1 Tax=Takifugu flavidus TaxID=433684 RepID=A0A5C6P891_9TELE|nr:hypothetical protein D4764_13G0005740 [Takifugu flavidus]